jgi:hypothetical protein
MDDWQTLTDSRFDIMLLSGNLTSKCYIHTNLHQNEINNITGYKQKFVALLLLSAKIELHDRKAT